MGRPSGAAAWLLLAANLILLVVVWIVSLDVYGQLPPQVASWSSVWTGQRVTVAKSWSFFLYPVGQLLFSVAFFAVTRILIVRTPGPAGREPSPEDRPGPLRALREEVLYLALIFFNLMFIHLQTNRILLSRGLGSGINRAYFSGLVLMVIFILVPYYRIRRRIVLTAKDGPPGPR